MVTESWVIASANNQFASAKQSDQMGEIANVLEPNIVEILTKSVYPVFLCPRIICSPGFFFHVHFSSVHVLW